MNKKLFSLPVICTLACTEMTTPVREPPSEPVFDVSKYLGEHEVIPGDKFSDGVSRKVLYRGADLVSLEEVRLKSDISGTKYLFGHNHLYCSMAIDVPEVSSIKASIGDDEASLDKDGKFEYPLPERDDSPDKKSKQISAPARNSTAITMYHLWTACEDLIRLVKDRMITTGPAEQAEEPVSADAYTIRKMGLAGPR